MPVIVTVPPLSTTETPSGSLPRWLMFSALFSSSETTVLLLEISSRQVSSDADVSFRKPQ